MLRKWLPGVAFVLLGLTVSAQQADQAGTASPKLSTVLADLAAGDRMAPQSAGASGSAWPKSVQDASRGRLLRFTEANEVQVHLVMRSVDEATLQSLREAGLTIEATDATARRVQGHIAPARLQALAALDAVNAVRTPTYARHRTGTVTSEGDHLINADALRLAYGLDGNGIRVGVISDGLKGVFATGCTTCAGLDPGPMVNLELPTAIGTRNASGVLTTSVGGIVGKSFRANGDLEGLPPTSPVCSFAGSGAEGTALLEIVHDVAPGAKLTFANADTDVEFMQAVNFLAASNDVVIDDMGFYGLPYDGTSTVSRNTAAALNSGTNPIRAYITAAGNDADQHYYGAYTDSGVDGTTVNGIANPGRLHLFQRTTDTSDVLGLGSQAYNSLSLPANGEAVIYLSWNDPFGGSANNYDLFLVRQSTGQVVARSTNAQTGTQDPVEFIDYVNNTGARDYFRVVVQNVRNAAAARNLNIFSFQPECAASGPELLASGRRERLNFNTPSRSISAQADAGGSPASVLAVGAVCSASATAASGSGNSPSCLDTSNSTAESFSSRGPTLDGRIKPDLVSIDGVSVSGAGKFPTPFYGTSAAVPHVGGVAALLLQAAPCLLNRVSSTIDAGTARVTLSNMMLKPAVSLGGSSPTAPNATFGYGRLDAMQSVATTLARPPAKTSFQFDANSPFGAIIKPVDLGFTDPNGCTLTAINWDNAACGSGPGTQMTCPVGTTAVNVSVSNNGGAYSAAVPLNVTVTGFSLAASPASATVTAGKSATYKVSVASSGGPYKSDIALSCSSLPLQTTCTFDPPTINPNGGTATSTLTVTTTAAAAVPVGDSTRGTWWMPRLPPIQFAPSPWLLLWPLSLAGLWMVTRQRPGRRLAGVVGATVMCALAAFKAGAPVAAMDPGIGLFPASLTFADQIVGTTSPPQLLYLSNTGGDTLNLLAVGLSPDFTRVSTTCGTSLAPGASCGVAIAFSPTAAGARSGVLSIADNSAGSPHVVSLTGTGLAATTTGATAAGTYGIVVNGVAGSLTVSSSVTLVVQ